MIARAQYQELLADSRVVAFRRGCETLSTVLAALPWAALFLLTGTVLATVSLIPLLVLFCALLPVRFFVGLPVLFSPSSLVFLAGWITAIVAIKWTAVGGFLDWVLD